MFIKIFICFSFIIFLNATLCFSEYKTVSTQELLKACRQLFKQESTAQPDPDGNFQKDPFYVNCVFNIMPQKFKELELTESEGVSFIKATCKRNSTYYPLWETCIEPLLSNYNEKKHKSAREKSSFLRQHLFTIFHGKQEENYYTGINHILITNSEEFKNLNIPAKCVANCQSQEIVNFCKANTDSTTRYISFNSNTFSFNRANLACFDIDPEDVYDILHNKKNGPYNTLIKLKRDEKSKEQKNQERINNILRGDCDKKSFIEKIIEKLKF